MQREERGLSEIAAALAELDATAGLAELARQRATPAPSSTTARPSRSAAGAIPWSSRRSRAAKAGPFIENDCVLGRAEPSGGDSGSEEEVEGGRIWLVTGPNMAGKSTFLRQNA